MANKTPATQASGQWQLMQAGDTVDPAFLPAGVASGPMQQDYVSGAGPTLSTTEATIGTITLTGLTAGRPVLIVARVQPLKDAGTTVRLGTFRVRRGTTNADTQVGRDCNLASTAVATTAVNPAVIAVVDDGHAGGSVTWTVRGSVTVASAMTTPNYEITAVELTGVKGDTGPAASVTGTGFVHATSGVLDGAAVAEVGTGSVVRAVNSVMTGTTIMDSAQLNGTLTWDGTSVITADESSNDLIFSSGNIATNYRWRYLGADMFSFNLTSATFAGTITAAGTFASSTTTATFATSAAGTVQFRPNGSGSATGQTTINSAGLLTATSAFGTNSIGGGEVTTGQNLYSTSANLVFGTTGAGTIFLRPNGVGSGTGQATLDAAGNFVIANSFTSSQNHLSSGASWVGATNGAGTMYLRPNGSASSTGEVSLTSAGGFTTNGITTMNYGGGTATNIVGVSLVNGTYSLGVLPKITGGSYNSTNQTNDTAVVAFGPSNVGVLNLTSWSSTAVGVRITPTDVTVTGNSITLTGPVTGSSTVSDSKGDVRTHQIQSKTANYTLAATDSGTVIKKTGGSIGVIITVPLNATVPIPVGFYVDIINVGISINVNRGTAGVTMYKNGVGGDQILNTGYGFRLTKVETDIWQITGG